MSEITTISSNTIVPGVMTHDEISTKFQDLAAKLLEMQEYFFAKTNETATTLQDARQTINTTSSLNNELESFMKSGSIFDIYSKFKEFTTQCNTILSSLGKESADDCNIITVSDELIAGYKSLNESFNEFTQKNSKLELQLVNLSTTQAENEALKLQLAALQPAAAQEVPAQQDSASQNADEVLETAQAPASESDNTTL